MMKARSLRADVTAQLVFKTPIFQWQQVPGRFFAAIYEAISPRFNVSTRDFTVANTTMLGEIWARFSLFGGNNAITLFSDRLAVQFQALGPADYPIATEIIRLGHDAFVGAFAEIEAAMIEYRALEHFELIGRSSSDDFFARLIPSPLAESGKEWAGLFDAGLQFKHTSPDKRAVVTCLGERSVLSASGIFLAITVTIGNASGLPTFDEKYQQVADQLQQCFKALELELTDDGDSSAG